MDRWRGRVALVTGASAGIGLALVEALTKHGMKVVGCARNIEKIEALSSRLASEDCHGGVLSAIRCDVSSEEQIVDMFNAIRKLYGGVDVCVNSAGLSHSAERTSLLDGDGAAYREMLNVNVLGLTICSRETIRCLRQRGLDEGHIINVSSIAGHRILSPQSGFYSATKFAVRALTEGLRQELNLTKSRIRVSAVSPGLVETEFLIRMLGEEKGREVYKARPVLHADDVVNAIIYQLAAPPHAHVCDMLMLPTTENR